MGLKPAEMYTLPNGKVVDVSNLSSEEFSKLVAANPREFAETSGEEKDPNRNPDIAETQGQASSKSKKEKEEKEKEKRAKAKAKAKAKAQGGDSKEESQGEGEGEGEGEGLWLIFDDLKLKTIERVSHETFIEWINENPEGNIVRKTFTGRNQETEISTILTPLATDEYIFETIIFSPHSEIDGQMFKHKTYQEALTEHIEITQVVAPLTFLIEEMKEEQEEKLKNIVTKKSAECPSGLTEEQKLQAICVEFEKFKKEKAEIEIEEMFKEF